MTASELNRLRDLAQAATPGPWRVEARGHAAQQVARVNSLEVARLMTNHPNRRARGGPSPSGLLLRELRERAGLTQAQAGALVRVSEIAWRSWENGARRMPAPAMELLCIVLAVGTVERGPYVPPGDWMRSWVRDELCLWFRRAIDPALNRRSAPQPAVEAASPAQT